MYHFKTHNAKPQDIKPQWWILDASQKTVGRIASQIAFLLQGKHKPYYSPNLNCGDKIIVINADKVRFTGKKMTKKTYISHTGYPSGQRIKTPQDFIRKNQPTRILELAVKRMLPKTRLQKPFMKNLFLYTGTEHNHTAQKPQTLNLT